MPADFDPLVAKALQLDEHAPAAYTDERQLARAWTFLAAGDDRNHGGNDGYDDEPSSYYSWDSTVPNAKLPKAGDPIVLRNKDWLLGASVIERVEEGQAGKVRRRCPKCGSTSFNARTTREKRFRCAACKAEFDRPTTERIEVVTYRCHHEAGWVDLNGLMSARDVSECCISPGSQHSLRPLDWTAFAQRLEAEESTARLKPLLARAGAIHGGHRETTVRARVGQQAFRARLLGRDGARCALTGPAPPEALEAAHLYGYAEVGRHDDAAGLLLRRDIHRLFDMGLITVRPDDLTIQLAPEILGYPTYAPLHGTALAIEPSKKQRQWLRRHWDQYAPADGDGTPQNVGSGSADAMPR